MTPKPITRNTLFYGDNLTRWRNCCGFIAPVSFSLCCPQQS